MVLKVDSNNDWTYIGNQANYISGLDAVVQAINTRLQEWKEDCFFNTQAGLYWNIYLGEPNQKALMQTAIYAVIAGTKYVNQVDFVKLTPISQNNNISGYEVQYKIQTIYSTEFITATKSIVF